MEVRASTSPALRWAAVLLYPYPRAGSHGLPAITSGQPQRCWLLYLWQLRQVQLGPF
jgi:hypothetical protein